MEDQQVLRQLAQLVMVETVVQAQDAKAVEVGVLAVVVVAMGVLVEQVVNQQVVVAVVVVQQTDQLLEPVAQAVLV